MAIEWECITGTYVTSLDKVFMIKFLEYRVINDDPIAFHQLFFNNMPVYTGMFDACIDKANTLEIENITPAKKFEKFVEYLEALIGEDRFNTNWYDKSGNALTMSIEDMQAVLELAKKGAQHE